MVRNGVVRHPTGWQHGGYNEIQNPPQRYALINCEKLIANCGLGSDAQLHKSHRQWVEESVCRDGNVRQPEWTESIAVGSEGFVQGIQQKLKIRAKGRKVRVKDDYYKLKEAQAAYNLIIIPEISILRVENGLYWSE